MLCRYLDENGTKKTRSRAVPRLDDDDLLRRVKENIASEIQQFFTDHHHRQQDSDGNELVEKAEECAEEAL